MLFKGKRLKHQSIPLVLKGLNHRRKGGSRRGAGSHIWVSIDRNEVYLGERFVRHRARIRGFEVLDDEALFEHVARFGGEHRFIRGHAADGAEHRVSKKKRRERSELDKGVRRVV